MEQTLRGHCQIAMLNKINTLLPSQAITQIKEFKATTYNLGSGDTNTTLTLPAGITEGSLGLFVIGATKGSGTSSAFPLFGTPTGFTLISKDEDGNAGTGRAGSQGLFYKYMTAADSSTTISTIFTNSVTQQSRAVFLEVILNKKANSKGFNSLTAINSSAAGGFITITDVPSVIPNNSPFFILGCVTDSDGNAVPSFSGGMEAYDTSETAIILDNTSIYLWKYDNVQIANLPDTADATVTDNASGFGSEGVYVIWLK